MKKKRLRLKKWVWVVLILIILATTSFISFKKIKAKYDYERSDEYLLLGKGYTKDEIKLINETLDKNTYEELKSAKKKDETIIELISHPHFKKANYDRYIAYLEKYRRASVDNTVNTINLNLDYEEYETGFSASLDDGYEVLVNKFYMLDASYVPDNLEKVSVRYCWGDNHFVKKEVYDAFLNMWEDANASGLYLMINQGYYSYEESNNAYTEAKEAKGQKYADKTYLRPGANDYQTGLALAIFEKKSSSRATFKDTEAFSWLKDNAYKYGFILRFPEGKENITLKSSEPWHWRYVGIKAAEIIHNNNLTLEEYHANYK